MSVYRPMSDLVDVGGGEVGLGLAAAGLITGQRLHHAQALPLEHRLHDTPTTTGQASV